MLTLCHNYFRVTPSNKNNKDAPQRFNKRKFACGVFILLLVVVLWVVSSEMTKYIYTEKHIERPFLVTYLRSSLLFIYLIILCFTPPTRDPCQPADYTSRSNLNLPNIKNDHNFSAHSLNLKQKSMEPNKISIKSLPVELTDDIQLLEPTAETDDENYFNESNSSLGDSTFIPVRAGETTDSDDAAPRAVRFNKVAEVRVMSAAMASEALLARLSWAASVRATEHAQRRAAAAATRRHLRLALLFCIPWFISNYLYRLSIQYTSTASATMYTSTAGAFALSLGAIFAQVPHDRFTLSKFIAVLLTAAGLVVLGISESHQTNWIAVLAALGSALCYAIHLLVYRQALRTGDDINSPLLVGLVGCACGCLTWVMGGVLAAGGVERADLPPPRQLTWLLLDAALGPLLLESLWLWGKSLTSPQAATGILGLAVPLSLCAEAWRGGGGAWRGVAAALAGAGWAAAAAHLPPDLSLLTCLTNRLRAAEGFTVIRNMPDLDEQSEALISSDEPT